MTYEFTLLIDGPDLMSDSTLDAFFAAGCDDATFGTRGRIQYATFDREAVSFVEALTTAIHAIESAIPHARVIAWSRADVQPS